MGMLEEEMSAWEGLWRVRNNDHVVAGARIGMADSTHAIMHATQAIFPICQP